MYRCSFVSSWHPPPVRQTVSSSIDFRTFEWFHEPIRLSDTSAASSVALCTPLSASTSMNSILSSHCRQWRPSTLFPFLNNDTRISESGSSVRDTHTMRFVLRYGFHGMEQGIGPTLPDCCRVRRCRVIRWDSPERKPLYHIVHTRVQCNSREKKN